MFYTSYIVDFLTCTCKFESETLQRPPVPNTLGLSTSIAYKYHGIYMVPSVSSKVQKSKQPCPAGNASDRLSPMVAMIEVSSEQAGRRALERIIGPSANRANDPEASPNKMKRRPAPNVEDDYSLSPSPEKARPVAFAAGTRLNVLWADGDLHECTIVEWRMHLKGGTPVYVHQCSYDGGLIEHDLSSMEFQVLRGLASDDALQSPLKRANQSPLKAHVLKRGRHAVHPEQAALEALELTQTNPAPYVDATEPEYVVASPSKLAMSVDMPIDASDDDEEATRV